MTIGILTTITNPDERQDKWREALECYEDFADEVVVVDGSDGRKDGRVVVQDVGKTKYVYLLWPYEWNWVQLPKSLNAGREQSTSDWILKCDIDQFFHEKDFDQIRKKLAECPKDCQVATFQKMSMAYGGKYYQKGEQPIAFRNEPGIVIGQNLDKETDLCFAIKQTGYHIVDSKEVFYELPSGRDLPTFKTGITYWNYDYFFKTKEFTKKEFWRFSKAYQRYFGTWKFGNSEEASFNVFLNMMKARYKDAPYTCKLEDHSKYIRKAVEELNPNQCGFNLWGL